MDNKAVIQFTDASVHEVRMVESPTGRKTYAYIRDRGNPPVMYRFAVPESVAVKPGMLVTLTGWISGGWRYDRDSVTVCVVPYAEKLEVGMSLGR